jgi:hypothetical protein
MEDVFNENKIKCNDCKKDFHIKNKSIQIEYRSQEVNRESFVFKRRRNLSLKREFEISIRMFFQFYNAFIQQRTKLDSNVSRNFQEMIFKIDEHRGKLKRKIDLIASNMID